MPTIDQLRNKAEADIARLLRRLNKDRRAEVIAAVERYGSVAAVPESFWEELKREVDGEIAAILLLLMVPVYDNMTRRVARVSPPTPEPPGRSTELEVRTAAAQRAAQLGREAASAHIEYTRSRLDTAHRDADGDAETFRTNATDIMRTRPKQGERDAAETTGITTTTRGISTAERAGANDEGIRRGVEVDVKWVTEKDGKVCFVAGTSIKTSNGFKPIEQVSVGEMVATRSGLRKVVSVARTEYFGPMVTVFTDKTAFTCTADHPIWTLEKQWVAAGDLNSSLSLYGIDDESQRVRCVHKFFSDDANHLPVMLGEVFVFSGISGLITVPVGAIDLDGNPLIDDGKVNRVPAEAILWDSSNTASGESKPSQSLGHRLGIAIAIACKAAELPVRIAWFCSKLFAATLASDKHWRTAAKLGAILPVQVFLRAKSYAATLARHVLRVFGGTRLGAVVEPVCIGSTDTERLAASDAGFFNTAVEKSTLARAANIATGLGPARRKVEASIAFGASSVDAGTGPLGGGELELTERQGHVAVYDLQVEEEPEFFANGIVAHNCPICAPLDGRPSIEWVDQFPVGPPAHPNCRCDLAPYVKGGRPQQDLPYSLLPGERN